MRPPRANVSYFKDLRRALSRYNPALFNRSWFQYADSCISHRPCQLSIRDLVVINCAYICCLCIGVKSLRVGYFDDGSNPHRIASLRQIEVFLGGLGRGLRRVDALLGFHHPKVTLLDIERNQLPAFFLLEFDVVIVVQSFFDSVGGAKAVEDWDDQT